MNPGTQTGYYTGLFFRFLWLFTIAFIFQSIIFYMFDYNWFTFYVLSIIFSFFINTSLPMKENYPFFRHLLIFICLYVANSECSSVIINIAGNFFMPTIMWNTFIIISVLFGIANGIGRYGFGVYSKTIEVFSNLALLVLMIIVFATNWWEGGVVYFVLRIPIMMFEISIAKSVLYYAYERSNGIDNNAPL